MMLSCNDIPQLEVQHVTHVYHTADPIAMGTCNGIASSCYLGGYAMESRCVLIHYLAQPPLPMMHS